jgi:predicted amidophosphoribosyltransferase
MIHHLKYEGYTLVADTVADTVMRALRRPRGGVLVPVPLGHRRERRRGYNQAAVIARALGGHWRLAVAGRLLARRRETRSQTALTPRERERNVAGAFVAAPPPHEREREVAQVVQQPDGVPPRDTAARAAAAPPTGGKWRGGAVILIDDVLTTGATLAAAADALAAAGWPRVEAVTFARAVPFARRIGSA